MPDPQPLPVIRSIPAIAPLVQALHTHYGLDIIACHLIKSLLLDTYRVTTPDSPYIFRLYRVGQRSLDEILSELEILDYLLENGLSVSAGIKTKHCERVVAFSMPEGTRYGALFSFSPGEPLSKHLTCQSIQAYGKSLAHLHRISDAFPHPITRPSLDRPALLDVPAQTLKTRFPDERDHIPYLQSVAGRLRPVLDALPTTLPAYGFCHGDPGTVNVHRDENGGLELFDFDYCGPGWRAYELAVVLNDLRGEPPELTEAFLGAYSIVRPLSEQEHHILPTFQAIQHLWALGVHAANADEWGVLRLEQGLLARATNHIRKILD